MGKMSISDNAACDWNMKRERAQAKIDEAASALDTLSQDIWSHPELEYEERHAHKVLTDYLEKEGFQVTKNYHLETAFKATYGSDDGIHVCVICEYDALPDIGHACGHNLIAECGVAAGLGLKAALSMDDTPLGRVTVLGTPAEEGRGGKKDLIAAGAFEGVDVALMAHPYAMHELIPSILSIQMLKIRYSGRAAHAAAAPWEGLNALDAAVMCYSSISVMRQQFKPKWRVHGVFTNGGAKPNIIPEEAELSYSVRAPNERELALVLKKVEDCAKGASIQTGCQVSIERSQSYANLITNPTLISMYKKEAQDLGVEFGVSAGSGSTDMGDVSHVLPSIHPMFGIGTQEPNHTRSFTDASGAAKAQAPTLVTAKTLALIGLELMRPGNDQLMQKIRKEFEAQLAEAK